MNGLVGSTARMPTVSPRLRQSLAKRSTSVLLPAPGGPVMPTTRALPVCGVEAADQLALAFAAVLDERDGAGEGARLALQQARHEVVQEGAELTAVPRASHQRPLISWRAITRRWISLVPSPMVQILASR